MATYSSVLAWRIPWTEEPGWLQSMGSQRVRHDWATNTSPGDARGKESACPCRRRGRRRFDPWVWKIPPGEGNGNPLLYSCLGNPMERGAWRAAIHGVTEGQTRLGTAQHNMEVLITTFSLRKWFVWVSDVSTKLSSNLAPWYYTPASIYISKALPLHV